MQNMTKKRTVYVVGGARSPFLKMRQGPGPFSAADLAVEAGKALVRRYVSPTQFDQVIVGCACPSEEEANIARVIALRLGCGDKVPAWTVQRNCASGLQAIDAARKSIETGESDLILAGGTEAMSRAPLLYGPGMSRWLAQGQGAKGVLAKLKWGLRFRPNFLRPIIGLMKGLTDPVVDLNMGQTAEEVAYRFKITREEMDAYAAMSHARCLAGQAQQAFEEITPIISKTGQYYDRDEGVREDSTVERLAKLKPAFEKFGNITAGNSSQISDGAAWVILASEEAVQRYNLPVLAEIVDVAWAGLDPAMMGLGPVHAMTALLQNNQLSFEDIDHYEINEAFAAQVLGCLKAWEDPAYCEEKLGIEPLNQPIEMSRLNPQGGAIAIGHPVGASGARLVLHCSNMLIKNNQKYALASLCIGGGQGGAILLARAGGL